MSALYAVEALYKPNGRWKSLYELDGHVGIIEAWGRFRTSVLRLSAPGHSNAIRLRLVRPDGQVEDEVNMVEERARRSDAPATAAAEPAAREA